MEKDINNIHDGDRGFYAFVTIDSLGDTGNKTMHLGGSLLLFSGVIIAFQMNRKK